MINRAFLVGALIAIPGIVLAIGAFFALAIGFMYCILHYTLYTLIACFVIFAVGANHDLIEDLGKAVMSRFK